MEDWLRREAMLGVGVLLCVALLALFAGSLTQTQAAPKSSPIAFQQTHTVSGDNITLQASPLTFGENTFTVTVTDAQGNSVSGATAELVTTNQDMDMGDQTLELKPVGGAQPGVYQGQGDLTMAGNWVLTASVTPAGAQTPITTDFSVVVGSQAGGVPANG